MTRDERFIRKALKKAEESQHYFQTAALIAKGSRILAAAVNCHKTHPLQEKFKPLWQRKYANSTHAELRAIVALPQELLQDATLYVARRLKCGLGGLSRPCAMCRKVIEAAGLKRVVYTSGLPEKEWESYELL